MSDRDAPPWGGTERFGFGGHVLDLSGRTLYRDGRPLAVRRKVFDVLAYLVVNRQRVVTKEELIREVWAGANVSDDVITGSIRSIRTALGDNSRAQAFIRTAHGLGYQFVAPVEPVLETPPAPSPVRKQPKITGWTAGVMGAAILVWGGVWLVRQTPDQGAAELIPSERLWLRFEERAGDMALDSSGRGNHARIRGGVRRVAGVLGAALEFDGIAGYLEGFTPGAAFPSGDSPRTVVCWVRTTDHNDGDRNLLHWGTPTDQPPRLNFHLFLSQGRAGWGNGYDQGQVRSAQDLADGRWRQVAGVHSGPPVHAAYVYVDGKQAAASTEAIQPNTRAGANWTVGVFMEGGTPFHGALDDLRLFQAALSASTIQALRNCAWPEPGFQAPFAGRPYFVPVGNSELDLGAKDASESSIPLENRKEFFGAAQYASSDGRCAVAGLHGASLPPSVRIAMDVEPAPTAGSDDEDLAGPFLEAPPMGPHDRISRLSGLWIALSAKGSLSVRRLPRRELIIASSPSRPGFDARKAHRLVVERRPAALRILLDGSPALALDSLPAAANQAAGIAFRVGRKPLSGLPQRVRNLSIEPL